MRVLVVEDEPALLSVVAQALREAGYAVDEAADGETGLYKATAWEYDAVVLDIDAAEAGRLVGAGGPAEDAQDAGPDPDRPRRRSATASAGWTPGPTTTWSSRST